MAITREELSRIRSISASKGGKATTQKGKQFLVDRATKGGVATITKYGVEYYSYQLGKKKV
jgi:hypothetical protein